MLYLSLGENCLPDNILDRYSLKSFSTPFSHGRSNIDYALQLENDNYNLLLKPAFLRHEELGGQQVTKNFRFEQCDDIFDKSVARGFEFTHHNVISNEEARKSYLRKVIRMKEIKNNEDITFLYHHRRNPRSNFKKLYAKLEGFLASYKSDGFRCNIILFSQEIINEDAERRIRGKNVTENLVHFTLFTKNLWRGKNQDIFWARVDDDLIAQMFSDLN